MSADTMAARDQAREEYADLRPVWNMDPDERWGLNEQVAREVFGRPTRHSTDGQWRCKWSPASGWSLVQDYAREMGDAWCIVRHLRMAGWEFQLSECEGGEYEASFSRGDEFCWATHAAPTLAICHAALQAAAPQRDGEAPR